MSAFRKHKVAKLARNLHPFLDRKPTHHNFLCYKYAREATAIILSLVPVRENNVRENQRERERSNGDRESCV